MLLCVNILLAAAAQHNFCMGVFSDKLFQPEQKLLFLAVDNSTARIQRAYKLLKRLSKREDHGDFGKGLVEFKLGWIILLVMLLCRRNGLKIFACQKTALCFCMMNLSNT